MANHWYFYHQKDGEDAWLVGHASDRAKIVEERQPRYTTVLDVDTNFNGDMDRETQLKAHYRGDLYIDIDVSKEMGGIETAIKQVNTLLDKYEAIGVKLQSLRIFCSGSKGFHVEIPRATFLAKESKAGYPKLPLIYKEMVHRPELYVDGIDPRVYSAQRGRMWRTTNVQRENGRYKVQVTLDECRGLTPEIYDQLVSGPRHTPTTALPEYCSDLAVAFATAQDDVEKRLKSVLKSKLDPAQVARWAKKPPAELQRLMSGQGIKEGAGFHPIAIQVALAATSFKWSVDEMLERCEGLIENHVGDGNRYDTPRKRQRELVRMWYYYEGGSGTYYEFALAPIRTLIEVQPASESSDPEEGPDGETEDEEELLDHVLTSGVKIRRWGLFKTVDSNTIRASAIGFDNVTQMIDTDNDEVLGYQSDMFLDGKLVGSKLLPMSLFTSRQSFQSFALANGGASVQLTDAQVVGMAEIFRNRAMKLGKTVHMVGREGLDYLRQLDGSVHAVYVSHEEAFVNTNGGPAKEYKLKLAGRESIPLRSNLLHAPKLSGTEEERQFLKKLLKVNKRESVAKMLGWFSAAFYSQAIRLKRSQFPLLHVYGTAGAGKTKTAELMVHMHYYRNDVEIAMATMLTPFAMKSRLASSSSIPIIWDEVKFHEMAPNVKHNITQYLRNNYVAAKSEAGTVRKDSGQSHIDLRGYVNGAPLVFIGETMETETAIAERYVAVALTKQDRVGKQRDFDDVFANRDLMGHIGKSLVADALVVNLDEMASTIAGHEAVVAQCVPGESSDESRRVFNYAVTLYGLDRLDAVINQVFPGEFTEAFIGLRDAMIASVTGDLPRNMSESSKVLDAIAFLTKSETEDQFRLIYGTDYTVEGNTVDLKLQNAFNKYLRHSKSIGMAPLFPDYGRFVAAMRKYPATVDTLCHDNESLKDSARVDVYRFSAAILEKEGVDVFRN